MNEWPIFRINKNRARKELRLMKQMFLTSSNVYYASSNFGSINNCMLLLWLSTAANIPTKPFISFEVDDTRIYILYLYNEITDTLLAVVSFTYKQG